MQCATFISFLKSAIFVPKSSLRNMFLQPPKHPEVPRLSAKEVLDIRLRGGNLDDWGVGEQAEMMDDPKNQSKQRGPEYFWSLIPLPSNSYEEQIIIGRLFCSQNLECCSENLYLRASKWKNSTMAYFEVLFKNKTQNSSFKALLLRFVLSKKIFLFIQCHCRRCHRIVNKDGYYKKL